MCVGEGGGGGLVGGLRESRERIREKVSIREREKTYFEEERDWGGEVAGFG